MVISRPKMTFVGQFAPPCASTRRGLSDGVGEKICPQNSIFLKNQISPRPLGEVGVKKTMFTVRGRGTRLVRPCSQLGVHAFKMADTHANLGQNYAIGGVFA